MFYQITSVVLLIVASIRSQQIGNNCITKTNQPGICRIVNDCESVKRDMMTRRRQEVICGHINLVPVVCCPIPKRRTSTLRPSIHSRWRRLSKSEQSTENNKNIIKKKLTKKKTDYFRMQRVLKICLHKYLNHKFIWTKKK